MNFEDNKWKWAGISDQELREAELRNEDHWVLLFDSLNEEECEEEGEIDAMDLYKMEREIKEGA